MKKLMIAVAAVACAVAANAATFSWSAEGVKDASGNASQDQVGFFFYGSDSGSAVTTWTIDAAIAAVTGATAPTLGAQYLVVGDAGGLAGGEFEDITVTAGEKVGGFIVMTDINVNDLVFDDNTGAIIGGWTAPEKYSVISGGNGALVSIDGSLDTDYPFAFTAATGATQSEWQSVPEPTSGLLLLIGVAGLALRRRRA